MPEGHRLDIHRVSPLPRVGCSAAGVWLAHLGVSSDDLEEELDHVLLEVEALVAGPRPQVFFVTARGPISSLMAPANPERILVSGHLVWTFSADALAAVQRAPALVQRMLRCMYATSRAAITQSAFVQSVDAAPARAIVELIRELGVAVREPDPENMSILAEVHRPEGFVLSALLGAPHENAKVAGTWAREVNEEKDRAAGYRERRARLEEEERRALEQRLAADADTWRVAPVDRAPRLRRLLLATARDGGDTARKALFDELLCREIPLLFVVDPKTRGARLRSWPAGFEAPAIYADRSSLLASARELEIPMDSFAIAEMTPPALFVWAAKNGWGVALCVFEEQGDLIHIPVLAAEVRALAQRGLGVG